MRLLIVVDQQYWQTPDGQVWTRMPPAYPFFESHLAAFSDIDVVARTTRVPSPPEGSRLATGPGVNWWPVAGYSGLPSFLGRLPAVLRAILGGRRSPNAMLLRGPSHLGNLVFHLTPRIPFGIEVLGNPEMLYPGRPLHRSWFRQNLEYQCRHAAAAGFVSRELERRYPTPRPHRLLDADLPPEAFASAHRTLPMKERYRIVTIGGFDHPFKGHDILFHAASRLRPVELTVVGGGRLRGQLEALAGRLGIQVHFAGQLGGAAAVRELLRQADLFVLASRTEGMPRALIEAIALGIPAVSTRVGGIPELLPPGQLAAPENAPELAKLIDATLSDPDRYARLSQAGLETAREYAQSAVALKRKTFLEEIRGAASLARPERLEYAR